MAVQARTLELYRQLSIADAVVAAGYRSPVMNLWGRGKRQAQTVLREAGDWCDSHSVPLHVFSWTAKHGKAGLREDALYLLRPDTWVAFADGEQSTDSLERYRGSRGITLSS